MAESHRFEAFTSWKRNLSARRQLRWQDQRPLYQYRLTEAEFTELEALLRAWVSKLSRFELSDISRLTGFPALFVLYAAEWWRRRFDGAHWSWEPILRDIGAEPEEWNQFQRSECVRLGLQDWGLKPRETGGLRFLGSVAVQGGLPLRLLAQARGKIGQLLSQVLRQAGSGGVTQSDLLTWVESLQTNLPRTYWQDAIFTLLADMAWTVLRLKEEAGLTSSANVIAKLDQNVPGWRERFPLPVEDVHAQGLVEHLICDAAGVRIERHAICLPLERQLVSEEDGTWTLRSSLALPDTIQAAQLSRLFDATTDELPRAAELALAVGGKRLTTVVRRMAGHDAYRIERKPWGYSGGTSSYEHVLHLSATDGRVWPGLAPKGEALDEDLPWVFSAEDGSGRFLRQGSGSVTPPEVLVALPAGWSIRPNEGSEASHHGQLTEPARRIVRVRGVVEAQSGDGIACRIRTGQAGSAEESYEWRGQRYWLDFQSPTMAFKGMPNLCRISQDGAVQRMEGSPGWSLIGAPTPANIQPMGPVALRYPATGEVKQRARVVVLPMDAALVIDCRDASSGSVRLENWRAGNARVVTAGIRQESRRDGNALTLSLSVAPGERTPEQVEIEVLWPHSMTPARLTVPFPGRGTRAFRANGEELRTGSLLAAGELAGVRLSVLDGGTNARITLEVESSHGDLARKHQLCALPGALGVEVRLQDFATDIQHLLSADDNPDAQVRIVLRVAGGGDPYRLYVARYAARLIRNGSKIGLDNAGFAALTTDDAGMLPVMALRLERPGDEALRLSQFVSEGVPTGSWDFPLEGREPGCWLIYPGPGAHLSFRPTRWAVPGTPELDSPLARAIAITNEAEREEALDAVIEMMADDFMKSCWIEVERLAGQVGHLPLTTLDLWRRFARSPRGMAALALRFGALPSGFVDRFDQELPFAWEAVPFVAWKHAMACLERQCVGTYGDETGALVFRTHLDSRIKDTAAGHGALTYLLGIAKAGYSSGAKQEIQWLKGLGATLASQWLFDGEDSHLMRLLRLHADDDWPTGFNSALAQGRLQKDVGCFMHSEQLAYRDGVINIPLLLAAEGVANQTGDWFDDPGAIHILRAHRAFDPDWFDEAYNLTVARCLAAGMLDN